jgi:3-oxoacyl-[acyl-carrier protein] reductase
MTSRRSENITGQHHVVVGAAMGIGRAAALDLVERGARVSALDRDVNGLKSLSNAVASGSLTSHPVDVVEERSVSSALGAAEATYGPIHALANCVGVTGRTGILSHEVSIEEFDEVYRVNLRGAMILSSAVLGGMQARGYGRVLHIASIAGKEGNPGMVAYSATKAGLIGMVKSQGKEYAGTGVTVNALAPAVIRTPLVDALEEETVEYMTAKIPMGRTGELSEAASLIAWILSPACSFTTGFTFDLSGGRATY